jgi:dATP pyrophosphohydrolase
MQSLFGDNLMGLYPLSALEKLATVLDLGPLDQNRSRFEGAGFKYETASNDLRLLTRGNEKVSCLEVANPRAEELLLPLGASERIPVQVYVWIVEGSRVLLFKRSPERNGFWQGVTGAPLVGETLSQAATRELFEETGFRTESLVELNYRCSYLPTEPWASMIRPQVLKIAQFHFYVQVSSEFVPKLSEEHVEFRWCTFTEADSLLLWPDNKKGLQVLSDVILNNIK